jgi:hypothetical protein
MGSILIIALSAHEQANTLTSRFFEEAPSRGRERVVELIKGQEIWKLDVCHIQNSPPPAPIIGELGRASNLGTSKAHKARIATVGLDLKEQGDPCAGEIEEL